MIFRRTAFVLAFATITLMSIGGARAADPGPVDKDAPEQFTKTDSGLKYRIRRKSDGKKPTSKSMVTVHYRGRLNDDAGDIFDTSYGTGGIPVQFGVGGVIPGWAEGLQLMSEGGMIELEVPSDLGYGQRGQPPAIPGNATLHFIVELVTVGDDVKPPETTLLREILELNCGTQNNFLQFHEIPIYIGMVLSGVSLLTMSKSNTDNTHIIYLL